MLRFIGFGSTFVNAAGATFDLQSDAGFTVFNGGNTFTNNGLFQKTGGTFVSEISRSSLDFDNAGTVAAQSGTIQFSGNGTHTDPVFTASAGGEVLFNAGVHTIVGTLSGTPAGTVRLDIGATLQADGSGATLDVGGTGLEWQSGNLGGDFTNVGLLRLTTSGVKDLNGVSTLTNQALVEMTDTGSLRFIGGNSQFVNASGATFDIQSDADFIPFNGGNRFTNDGLLVKSGVDPVNDPSDVSQISAGGLDFDNNGTVEARAGRIDLNGTGTHTNGTFTASASGDVSVQRRRPHGRRDALGHAGGRPSASTPARRSLPTDPARRSTSAGPASNGSPATSAATSRTWACCASPPAASRTSTGPRR